MTTALTPTFTHPIAGYRTYEHPSAPDLYAVHYPAILPNGLRSTGGRVTLYELVEGIGYPIETASAPDDDTADWLVRSMLGLDEGNEQ